MPRERWRCRQDASISPNLEIGIKRQDIFAATVGSPKLMLLRVIYDVLTGVITGNELADSIDDPVHLVVPKFLMTRQLDEVF